jgi:hypothetical protein
VQFHGIEKISVIFVISYFIHRIKDVSFFSLGIKESKNASVRRMIPVIIV